MAETIATLTDGIGIGAVTPLAQVPNTGGFSFWPSPLVVRPGTYAFPGAPTAFVCSKPGLHQARISDGAGIEDSGQRLCWDPAWNSEPVSTLLPKVISLIAPFERTCGSGADGVVNLAITVMQYGLLTNPHQSADRLYEIPMLTDTDGLSYFYMPEPDPGREAWILAQNSTYRVLSKADWWARFES